MRKKFEKKVKKIVKKMRKKCEKKLKKTAKENCEKENFKLKQFRKTDFNFKFVNYILYLRRHLTGILGNNGAKFDLPL